MNTITDHHLVIFCKNPSLGHCKTRLARSIGPENALRVYQILLQHTANVMAQVPARRTVFYSQHIEHKDCFDPQYFHKDCQSGSDLGTRMRHALNNAFLLGAKKAVLVGSDLYDVSPELIQMAFDELDTHETVIGPAQDGGYYLIGMRTLNTDLFKNKDWGTDTVLTDTLHILNPDLTSLLPEKNDIDTIDDLSGEELFKPFIK